MSCACVYWQDVVSEERADFRLARVSEDRQSRRAGCQPRGSHRPQVAPLGGHVPGGGPRSDRRAQPRHQARTHHGHGEQEEVTKTRPSWAMMCRPGPRPRVVAGRVGTRSHSQQVVVVAKCGLLIY